MNHTNDILEQINALEETRNELDDHDLEELTDLRSFWKALHGYEGNLIIEDMLKSMMQDCVDQLNLPSWVQIDTEASFRDFVSDYSCIDYNGDTYYYMD